MHQNPPASLRAGLRKASVLIGLLASALAAAAPRPAPPSEADVAAADAARRAPPQIPYNSGASPHEFDADAGKVTIERLANGTLLFHMNGQGMEAVSVHLRADGSMEFTCTDKAEATTTDTAEMANAHEQ